MVGATLSRSEQQGLIAVAMLAADRASGITLAHFRSSGLRADNKDKGGFDPVTIADRDAEAAMREVLRQMRPFDAIQGEEMGYEAGSSGLTWVLDPIDGTRAYISGAPTWGTLIALRDETGPILGVIDQPFTGERFIGAFGKASLIRAGQRAPIHARAAATLDKAILFSTFPEVGSPKERAAFEALSARVRLTRFGLDCYAYALLALGGVDLVVEAGLNAYDIQAPIALVQAAGGVVTNWQGGPAHDGGQVLAAASKGLHTAALKVLAQA